MDLLLKIREDQTTISPFYLPQGYRILVQFPPELAPLAQNFAFRRKLQDALDRQRQATRRVHWKPYGWLRLTQRGNDGVWVLWKEG